MEKGGKISKEIVGDAPVGELAWRTKTIGENFGGWRTCHLS